MLFNSKTTCLAGVSERLLPNLGAHCSAALKRCVPGKYVVLAAHYTKVGSSSSLKTLTTGREDSRAGEGRLPSLHYLCRVARVH